MKYVFEQGIDAYVADNQFRKRDPRFNTAERHKARARKDRGAPRLFRPEDFAYDETRRTCICPAGQRLYKNGANVAIRGFTGMKFTAPLVSLFILRPARAVPAPSRENKGAPDRLFHRTHESGG